MNDRLPADGQSENPTLTETNSTAEAAAKCCRAALLTPTGRGAIATVAVTGGRAAEIVGPFFRPLRGGRLLDIPIRNIVFGTWQGGSGTVEEVVVARLDESRVEIHCHGGAAASQAILDSLANAGVTTQLSHEWLRERTNNSIEHEAWLALSNVRTERAAGILLDQYRGALAACVADIGRLLEAPSSGAAAATARIDQLLQWKELGSHLTVPWRVVLAGVPNVGKSSLINALLGYERSIVFEQPGTTRDLLTANTALDGWPVELVDTAGYRETDDDLEREGSRRAQLELSQCDLAVIVVDPLTLDRERTVAIQQSARAAIVVVNKIDLCPSPAPFPDDWLRTSATTGVGVDHLGQAIARRLVPRDPVPGAAVPFTPRQFERLVVARHSLQNGQIDVARHALDRILRDGS